MKFALFGIGLYQNFISQKYFILRLFKMVANKKVCFKLEQNSIFKVVRTEKLKPRQIQRMNDVKVEACFNLKKC